MSYDEGLAERIREHFQDRRDLVEKKMFGGLCFMLTGHMCCGIVKDTLMARVGSDNYQQCLAMQHAKEMDFTGKAMTGMVYVDPKGFEHDTDLAAWLNRCAGFIKTLSPK